MQKILILGSTGFIGKSFKEFFLNNYRYQIIAPLRSELNLENREDCYKFLKRYKPDIIIHSAVNVNSVEKNINLLFNIMSFNEHYGRLIYFGSGAEYSKKLYKPLMEEDYSKNSFPESGYELSKYLCGREIENCQFNNVFNLRLFGVYGKYERYDLRPVSNNILRALSGLPIKIYQDMKLDYLFIDDLCTLIYKFINLKKPKFKTYNVCSGNPIFLTQLAKIIKDLMNVKKEIVLDNNEFKKEYSGDPSRIFKELKKIKLTSHKIAVEKIIEYHSHQFYNSGKYLISSKTW